MITLVVIIIIIIIIIIGIAMSIPMTGAVCMIIVTLGAAGPHMVKRTKAPAPPTRAPSLHTGHTLQVGTVVPDELLDGIGLTRCSKLENRPYKRDAGDEGGRGSVWTVTVCFELSLIEAGAPVYGK